MINKKENLSDIFNNQASNDDDDDDDDDDDNDDDGSRNLNTRSKNNEIPKQESKGKSQGARGKYDSYSDS